jgi:hypothetical protein
MRVVWGFGVTMATFEPTIAFRRVDLPTLERPTMTATPARVFLSFDELPLGVSFEFTQ